MSTILVVDDEVDLLHVTRDVLEDEGYRVVACSGGAAALAAAAASPPDLVLLDVMMPDVNGFDVATGLRDRLGLGRVPIVLMSAVDLARLAPPGEPAWQAFLRKPFTLDRLLELVHALLAGGAAEP